jgi:hypothetical protein
MSAVDVIDAYLAALPGDTRRLAHAEWGLTLQAEAAGGWPLDVGVRVSDELVRVQALVAPADPGLDYGQVLHWNRQTRLVRFGCARNGDIWVHGDVPVRGLDEQTLDRLLGLIAEGALAVRGYAAGERPSAGEAGGERVAQGP